MIDAPTLEVVSDELQYSFFENKDRYDGAPLRDKVKLVGLLFMHPNSELAKKDIIPRLGSYNQRSAEFTDFFFAGYGAWWPKGKHPDEVDIASVDGRPWKFSDSAFEAFRRQLTQRTSWKYSGETDLILATARFIEGSDKAEIDFSQCITCCLEQLLRGKAIDSVPSLFERIFEYAESNPDGTAYSFSDLHLIRTSKISLLDCVLSLIGLKDYYHKNE
jgi:hypothetical protein